MTQTLLRGTWSWRRCVLVILLAVAHGRLAAAQAPDDDRAILRAAVSDAGRRYDQGDSPGCRSALAPVRAIAWRNPDVGNSWLLLLAQCTFTVALQPVRDVPLDAVYSLVEPWRRHLAELVPPDAETELVFLRHYWLLLNQFGYRDAADAMLMPDLRQRVERAAAAPDDAEIDKALMAFAWLTNGSWQLHDYTRDFYALFRERLGEGHHVTLVTLRSMAYNERYLGRPMQALEHIEQAMSLTERYRPDDQALRTSMRSEHAACLAGVGRLAEALVEAQKVRDAVLARDPPSWVALVRSHYNLAEIAADMGDYRSAITYAEQSVEYARRSGDPVLGAEALVPGATREVSRLMLGEPGAAAALKAALVPTNADEMHIGSQIFALVRYAAQSDDVDMLNWSADFMRRFIRRYRAPFHADRAVLDLMDAWQAGGSSLHDGAVREPLERAVAGSLTGRSLATQALMQFSLARHLATSDPDTAIWLDKRAANALQRLRGGLPAGDDELHRAWLSVHEADLRSFIGLLIDQGRLVEAEMALLLLRDEELNDYTRRSKGRRDAPTRALSYTPTEAVREAAIEDIAGRVAQAAAEADQRSDARRTQGYKDRFPDEEADAALARLQGDVHELLAATPAPSGAATTPSDRGGRALPSGVARLAYFVRPDALEIVMQERRRYRRVSVPVARDELNRRVQALRSAVAAPEHDPLPASKALHALLIAPVSDWLRDAHSQQLQIVPDASLRYVPFAALHDGQSFLAQRYVLSTDLSGSARRESAPAARTMSRGIAAFGRSVGDGEHAALPGVVRELSAVTKRQGTLALDQAFTADSLRLRLAAHPATVHIASHFVIDPAGEDRSYLLTGDGRRLSLADLRQLPWEGVHLALLSACDSAISVEAGHGRELVGLANALLGAGVDNVVASLWRVSDGETADWMALFYARTRSSASHLMDPAQLTSTQRAWLRRHAGTALAHPHYWAAFQWMSAQ